MGTADVKYGDSLVYIQHMNSSLWLSYQTFETKKRGVGRVEEKKVMYEIMYLVATDSSSVAIRFVGGMVVKARGGTLNIYWCLCAAVHPKRGVLGTGTTQKRGGLRHGHNPKRGVLYIGTGTS